jgi:hypothetical protein
MAVRMDARIEAGIRSAIGSISGVDVSVFEHDAALARGRNDIRVDITLRGWSPSLHVHIMTWKTKFDRGAFHEEAVRQALGDLSVEMSHQRARLARGIALGRAAPFPIRSVETEVGHVRLDRGLAGLVADRVHRFQEGRSLRSAIAASIADLHSGIGSGRSNQLSEDDAVTDGVWTTMETVRPGMIFDGAELWIRDVLVPETVAAPAIGRRLGVIASVPQEIAGHVVTDITAAGDEGGTSIHVAPQHVTVDQFEKEMA